MRTKLIAPVMNIVPRPIIVDMEIHHKTIGINAKLCVGVSESIDRQRENNVHNMVESVYRSDYTHTTMSCRQHGYNNVYQIYSAALIQFLTYLLITNKNETRSKQ